MSIVIWHVDGREKGDRGGGCCCLGLFVLIVLAVAGVVWLVLRKEGPTGFPPAPGRPAGRQEGEAAAPLQDATAGHSRNPLETRGPFAFKDTDVKSALELLAEKAGLDLRVHESAAPLMDGKVDWETPSPMVRDALDRLAANRDLAFRVIEDERALLVRTRGGALREIDPTEPTHP